MKQPLRRSAPASNLYQLAAALGVSFTLAASLATARAGDILRGGAPMGAPQGGRGAGSATDAGAARARANAKDALARTSQAVQAVQAMQLAARNLARSGPNNLGLNPNQPARMLPNVPNGLGIGGLQTAPGVPINLGKPLAGEDGKLWQGATLPRQTVAGGKTTVTITQTTQQALLNWHTFNIGKETTLKFDQSKGAARQNQWIAFNKINDPTGAPSQILGSIEAGGQVYVINQNGIIFGGSSQVNTHSLVASSLPINETLVRQGLLDTSATAQFLFSARVSDLAFKISAENPNYTLAQKIAPGTTPLLDYAGTGGSPIRLVQGLDYTLGKESDGRTTVTFSEAALLKIGNESVSATYSLPGGAVTVQKGAQLSTPLTADHSGGKIALFGPSVSNAGTISTPDGQTILAAGRQVGLVAHDSKDPSLRGLDVYVGYVDQGSGGATNSGLISIERASLAMAGKSVLQLGAIASTTSVSLNGRIDLAASYNAIYNTRYNAADSSTGAPFLFQSTGNVELGNGSATEILPESWSSLTTVGTELALRSAINIQGRAIHLATNAMMLAPNANVTLQAGNWSFVQTPQPASTFISSGGQVYLDAGAFINLSGTTGVLAPLLQNLLSLQLRGAELAPSPLQRDGVLRGPELTVDLRKKGTFEGRDWLGTPLGDVTGYLGLIEREVGQLTVAGGSLSISAGNSVIVQKGALLDVSGGWTQYEGGLVRTTRLLIAGRLIDIADATPDQVYSGIFSGTSTIAHPKWGLSETYSLPLAPTGEHFQTSYIQGADAGKISISAPAMALDGTLRGNTVTGPQQSRDTQASSALPKSASLDLSFRAQDAAAPNYLTTFPDALRIQFAAAEQSAPTPFALDLNGDPLGLEEKRRATVYLSPELLSRDGFGSLTVRNEEGEIVVPKGTRLTTTPGGAISFTASNIEIGGTIISPGGTLSFSSLNISPYKAALISASDVPLTPLANSGRGIFSLLPGARLSAAGLLTDDRLESGGMTPISLHGGKVSIGAFSANLSTGSLIDVSGGVALSAQGKSTYGSGGEIAIKTGQDLTLGSVLGGTLALHSELRGYSGSIGGSLAIQAPLIQIGGGSIDSGRLLLQPEFFSTGGFGRFTISGLGAPAKKADEFIPAIVVAPGTLLEPVSQSLVSVPNAPGGLAFKVVQKVAGKRTPVSLELAAPGVRDAFTGGIAVRGGLILGVGSLIRTDPLASVSLTGNTVSLLGSIDAPAGSISISGGTNSSALFEEKNRVLSTVYIGASSSILAMGTRLLEPDPYGREIGAVLPGGTISVKGNLAAAAGARLDVSGASGMLDLSPARILSLEPFAIPASSGITSPLYSLRSVSTRLESDGGSISLSGGQMLFSEATLRGAAGGPSALGGSLSVGSGRFYAPGVTALPYDSNLVVSQYRSSAALPASLTGIGQTLADAHGAPLPGRGYFTANTFQQGGFDSLTLKGVVEFSGQVDIKAPGMLKVADGGVLYADAAVHLSAPYVALGLAFQPPLAPQDRTSPFNPVSFAPTHGSGSLTVTAKLIDVGTLSLQNIGSAILDASNGDIRGDGTFDIAGKLTLRASQVYPATAVEFNLIAYDYKVGELNKPGSILVQSSGTAQLPLSAAGSLALYASNIEQDGVLRAPFGSITIGWDGSGKAPVDILTGDKLAFPKTVNAVLGNGSITSVSAIDPASGEAIVVPYGLSLDGNLWIDPRGIDITAGGLLEKSVVISGGNLRMAQGALIDTRGGGDLFAYRWVQGNGGPADILASTQSFAVIPSYSANFSPYAPYNTSPQSSNLIGGADRGYANDNLKIGDRIYLSASESLEAGYYTLLPARYALLPGARLVTPRSGTPFGTIEMPNGASLTRGYRFNDPSGARAPDGLASWFEVAGSSVVRARAQYDEFFASTFFKQSAQALNVETPRLPADSGYLLLQATQAMSLLGSVLSTPAFGGHGASIDIDTPLQIVISKNGGKTAAGTVALSAAALNGFGAESLLIGGHRVQSADGTTVLVQSAGISVDNAGSPLSAPDLILVSTGALTLEAGARVMSSGLLTSPADTLLLDGNGALLRVSEDPSARIVRTVTPSGAASLVIRAGARVSGQSLTLDSTAVMTIDAQARLAARDYSINSGRISLQLDNPGELNEAPGLVLAGTPLENLQLAASLSMLSYSTLDIYGSGEIGGLTRLNLSAGAIRGFNQQNGVAQFAARTIVLSNSANAESSTNNSPSGSLVFKADSIRLGANQLAINQYAEVQLNASKSVIGLGKGGLSTQAALSILTPSLTGASGADRTISAGGTLNLSSQGSTGIIPGGLGSALSLIGSEVIAGSNIILPSGSLSIRATSGNVIVNGRLDVSGSARTFYDVVKYTDAGQIQLTSDRGDVRLSEKSVLSIAAQPEGGEGGNLIVSAAGGAFDSLGTLLGKGGSFELDASVLPSTAALSASLAKASLNRSQTIRVRNGDVALDGKSTAHQFALSVDQGAILVSGELDASGETGGEIILTANRSVVLQPGARLSVAGREFNHAGQGGAITLEAGSQREGIVGAGVVDIQTGSLLDLSVASFVAGDAQTAGTSAYQGQFSGQLHVRAPQNASHTDLGVNPINGTIKGPSSILVEGYRLYDLTGSNGTMSAALQTAIGADGRAFLGTAENPKDRAISARLLAGNASLDAVTFLMPGVEIINRSGDLVLGTASSTAASDWNLSTLRFGERNAPGILTLRASGNLTFFNALSDGFVSSAYNAQLLSQNTTLPINAQSWSYNLTAGADLGAADFGRTLSATQLGSASGFLQLGKNNGANISNSNGSNNTPGEGALTSLALANRFQVIRTGSGDIDIHAGRSVQLLNQFASIYTAGTRVANPTLNGAFDVPILNQTGGNTTLGAPQQTTANAAVQYSVGGGSVRIAAQQDIEHLTLSADNVLVADSQRELPANWLYRRGFVDPATGEFGTGRFGGIASTTWWVDFSNFFQGVGALGGGNVTMIAGHNISNVDAVIPTNARMAKGVPNAANLLELGGGDLTVRAGNNIDAGVYYVERGHGTLAAGNEIITNATRSPSLTNLDVNNALDPRLWLPTTLFVGKGGFDVSARGAVTLGPVANAFLLPEGINNTFWFKSTFSTYAPESFVNVSSLGGAVTLREGATLPSSGAGIATSLLQSWIEKQLLLTLNPESASYYQPWLRLNENSVDPYAAVVALMPPTVKATAFSGAINLVGDLTLSPAPLGTLELLANGSINGLQPNGLVSLASGVATSWGASHLNISDASPDAVPGITSPFAYQTIVGTSLGQARQTGIDFLQFVDQLFEESGATLGEVLQTKQARHSSDTLHLNDSTPTRLYTVSGDISGLTLFSPKTTRMIAGQDIADVALYIQNAGAIEPSIVAASRDIILYNANSPSRVAASRPGNISNLGSGPLAGDLQISGSGALQVLAGRNLDLGTGLSLNDGTGAGITSVGNARNPYLSGEGAHLVIGAGIGPAGGLAASSLDFDQLIAGLDGQLSAAYLGEVQADNFTTLPDNERDRIALGLFYRVLRDAGRDFQTTGNYDAGFAAIDSLIGPASYHGNVLARARDIRTRNGGDISILVPEGTLSLAKTTLGNPLSPPGIVTESGGNISIFTGEDVDIGIGRIFTLRGGNEIIWSSRGDIAAGASSKTVQSAPPTRVLIDPQSAAVQTDLAGLATGGGIGVLATVQNVVPGDVDLIAPKGSIDAGDAGIRVSGNLNIAAVTVLNADNIQVAGASAGASAAPAVAAPSLGGLAAPSSSVAAGSGLNEEAAKRARTQASPAEELPSLITVEVIGYGGGGSASEEEEEERRKKALPVVDSQ